MTIAPPDTPEKWKYAAWIDDGWCRCNVSIRGGLIVEFQGYVGPATRYDVRRMYGDNPDVHR